jgi:hypothetical protein
LIDDIDGNELYRITVDVANQVITQDVLERYIRSNIRLNYFSSLAEAKAYDVYELTIRFKIDKPEE